MNYIELVGPPAIGKSTLLKLLITSRKAPKKWYTFDEAIDRIISSLNWNQLPDWKTKLLYLINKNNITNYKRCGINNVILKHLTENISELTQTKYEYLIDAQLRAIQHLTLKISPFNKYSFLSWHIQSIRKLITLDYFKFTPTVLLAEGPLKTHHGLQYINNHDIQMSTLPKAVISCTLSIEKNIERINTRMSRVGRVSKIHNQLNEENLYTLVANTHQTAQTNLVFIKRVGIPTLEIDLTNPTNNATLSKIGQFVAHHSDPQRQEYERVDMPLVES